MLDRPAVGAGMFNGLGNLAIKAVSGFPECGGIKRGSFQQLPSGKANRTGQCRRCNPILGKLRFHPQGVAERLGANLPF